MSFNALVVWVFTHAGPVGHKRLGGKRELTSSHRSIYSSSMSVHPGRIAWHIDVIKS